MINFTLLINGSEVDLNDKVSIALTKTYESLEDPTKIFTDFSKTVTIPMTARISWASPVICRRTPCSPACSSPSPVVPSVASMPPRAR